ncbi:MULTISPECIES: hypothetical protein [unclassified Moorena]|uniref:hypothetical protein n=1 Tax=unclassified Moorena TaxID=2683338 RepID=UPI001400B693|nr:MULTISPECIES: hypothetical protein [unclassified Moorena]NEO13601.1 hypothetical protein [Moorena sp. SIO3E8]NEP99933.1 hypothetical protein [Moorena sp. SIO3F7]
MFKLQSVDQSVDQFICKKNRQSILLRLLLKADSQAVRDPVVRYGQQPNKARRGGK